MKRLMTLIAFFFVPILVFSQEPSKSEKPKREVTWVYDVNIVKDPTGKVVNVEKKVYAKGTPGAPIKIRWFETTELREGGIIKRSTTERIGENNVDPAIVKQYGGN